MQEKHLFEYAILRAVPRVEREEFMNIGVILYCRDLRFLDIRLHLDLQKLACLDRHTCVAQYQQVLKGIEAICAGKRTAGPIGMLPAAERFHWLTARRSTTVQTSAVHIGLTYNASETLQRIFEQMVL